MMDMERRLIPVIRIEPPSRITKSAIHHLAADAASNDRPENLELWIGPQPTDIRACEAVE
jgi:hypothetical protein